MRPNADRTDHAETTCPGLRYDEAVRYVRQRVKALEAVLPRMTPECVGPMLLGLRLGGLPREAALEIARVDLLPGVTRLVGVAAGLVRFACTSALLAALAKVSFETTHLGRTTERVGREIAAPSRCPLASMAPAFQCTPRKWPAAPASRRTA